MENNTKEILIKYLDVLCNMFEKDREINKEHGYYAPTGSKHDLSYAVFEYIKSELTQIRESLYE